MCCRQARLKVSSTDITTAFKVGVICLVLVNFSLGQFVKSYLLNQPLSICHDTLHIYFSVSFLLFINPHFKKIDIFISPLTRCPDPHISTVFTWFSNEITSTCSPCTQTPHFPGAKGICPEKVQLLLK